MKEGHIIVDGKVLISEVNDLLGLHMDDNDVDTIGGWIMMQKQTIVEGDVIERHGFF